MEPKLKLWWYVVAALVLSFFSVGPVASMTQVFPDEIPGRLGVYICTGPNEIRDSWELRDSERLGVVEYPADSGKNLVLFEFYVRKETHETLAQQFQGLRWEGTMTFSEGLTLTDSKGVELSREQTMGTWDARNLETNPFELSGSGTVVLTLNAYGLGVDGQTEELLGSFEYTREVFLTAAPDADLIGASGSAARWSSPNLKRWIGTCH